MGYQNLVTQLLAGMIFTPREGLSYSDQSVKMAYLYANRRPSNHHVLKPRNSTRLKSCISCEKKDVSPDFIISRKAVTQAPEISNRMIKNSIHMLLLLNMIFNTISKSRKSLFESAALFF